FIFMVKLLGWLVKRREEAPPKPPRQEDMHEGLRALVKAKTAHPSWTESADRQELGDAGCNDHQGLRQCRQYGEEAREKRGRLQQVTSSWDRGTAPVQGVPMAQYLLRGSRLTLLSIVRLWTGSAWAEQPIADLRRALAGGSDAIGPEALDFRRLKVKE